jgi:trehalose synthase
VVIWRCHVGLDTPNAYAREAWRFVEPYVLDADAFVFSRESSVWDGLDRSRVAVITPTIDVFTPKNEELDAETVRAVLGACGLVEEGAPAGATRFGRQDGTPGLVERRVALVEDERLRLGTPVVVQVSRWDALKDPVGVIRGFAEHVPASTGAHLVYAGPAVDAVADDPEGARVLRASVDARASLAAEARRRVHLAALPMADLHENAVIVNALQRHARIVVQKSLAEGFGLTAAEAMWKARPVVASRVGGIVEQIVDGESGVLLDDPGDLEAFGAAVAALLADPERAARLGRNAHERVRARFLSARSLLDYLTLVEHILRSSPRYAYNIFRGT